MDVRLHSQDRLVLEVRPKLRGLLVSAVYLLIGVGLTLYFVPETLYRGLGIFLSFFVAINSFDETETAEFDRVKNDFFAKRTRFWRTNSIIRTILDEVSNVEVEETDLKWKKKGYRLKLSCRGYAVPLTETYMIGDESREALEKQAAMVRSFLGLEEDDSSSNIGSSSSSSSAAGTPGIRVVDARSVAGEHGDEKEMLVEADLDALRKRREERGKAKSQKEK